jgi:GT2 family glycosyltransferase
MNLAPIKTPVTLSISCVYYDTETNIFEKTLESIADALLHAKSCKILADYEIHLINNNSEKELVFQLCIEKQKSKLGKVIIHTGQGNLGYGRSNNIAIAQTQCKYHLVLNPDIVTEIEAIKFGIEYLETNLNTGLVAPSVTNADGEIEYLAKRMPTFLIIFLRGLNKPYLNKIFKKTLDCYAYKDKIPSKNPLQIELASGCFMLCRSEMLKKIGGFSEKYFLYFEDFDLSKKISHLGKVYHLPQMKVCHLGGYAAQKGIKHTKLFLTSYFTFSNSFRKKN